MSNVLNPEGIDITLNRMIISQIQMLVERYLIHRLQSIIRELLLTKEYIEFLVGRDGEFDQLVSSTIRRCKRTIRDDNSSLVLVLPYMTAEYRNKRYFHRG